MNQAPSWPYGGVNPPIVRSSTFTFPKSSDGAARFAGEQAGLIYSRLQNPSVEALETELIHLEGAEACVATASGMGAIHVALMALLQPGSRLVADSCLYGCTDSLIRKLAKWGVQLDRIDASDPAEVKAALSRPATVVFIETPTNPSLRMVDIAALAKLSHAAGAKLIVDNTFATPVCQQPLKLGADAVVHSITKAINGHSDLIAGAVLGSAEFIGECRGWVKDAGAVMDAEVAWLCLRGIRTLGLRIREQNGVALRLAKKIGEMGISTSHPLLPNHPQHALALKQMAGGSHVFTIEFGSSSNAMNFMDHLNLFQRAVSLGGYESLVSHPASTTHACVPEETRAHAGITPGLVRVSVGVEGYDALLEDMTNAMKLANVKPIVA